MIIYGECNTECLFSKVVLGIKAKHLKGRDKIVSRIIKESNVIGIIDEDPGKPTGSYLKQIRSTQPISFANINIDLRKIKSGFIIEIKPDFENWLFNLSKKSNINLEEFNLPNNPYRLHDLISVKGRFEKLEERLYEVLKIIVDKNKKEFDKLKEYILK
jgi:hypothetical protein